MAVSSNGRFVVTSQIGGAPFRLIDRTLNTSRPLDALPGTTFNYEEAARVVSNDGASIWFSTETALNAGRHGR